jgi:hypothetical protein
MAGKTTTHEESVLNVLRGTNITAPANVYVGLYSANPTDAGGGTEISGNGYARQLCGFGAPSGTPRQIANAADILFPVQTPAAYANVTGVGIFSAITAGTLLYWVASAKTFNIGDQAKFAAGALIVIED